MVVDFFVIEGEKAVLSPEARTIAPFRKIIERDRGKAISGDSDGRKKYLATLELSYIYWFCNPKSSYRQRTLNDEEARHEKIVKALGLPEGWKVDELLQEAMNFYSEDIKEDFDIGFMEDAQSAADKTREYFRDVDYSAVITVGKSTVLKYKIKEVTSSLKEVPTIIENLKIAREKAYKSEKLNTNIRGGGTANKYERAK